MINVLEFFKNLPKKACQKCGFEMVEQADCYVNHCDDCNHPTR